MGETEIKALGHVMIDLETLGNESNSVITSIGAVEFDIKTGETGRRFYERCEIQSAINLGLIINGSTIEWWFAQSDEARKEISDPDGKKNIIEVLHLFTQWFNQIGPADTQVWGNSNRFDLGILNDAYRAAKRPIPWKFRNERDVRTLVSFAPEIKENHEFIGPGHHPIYDCLNQISYCSKTWLKLKWQ